MAIGWHHPMVRIDQENGIVKAEENFESGSSIAQRSTVKSGKWKVNMRNVDWVIESGRCNVGHRSTDQIEGGDQLNVAP